MTGNEFAQVGRGPGADDRERHGAGQRLPGAVGARRRLHRWREYYFAPRSLNYIEYEYTTWEVPTSGVDGEIGVRVPFVSDYCETWVYGGGYYFTDDLTPGIGRHPDRGHGGRARAGSR